MDSEVLSPLRERINDYFVGYDSFSIVVATITTLFALWFTKKLIWFCFDLKNNVIMLGLGLAKSIPGGQSIIDSETKKMVGKFAQSMAKSTAEFPKFQSIPANGVPEDELFALMSKMQTKEQNHWREGRCTGTIYVGNDKQVEIINRAFSMFTLSNPLHSDVFPSIRKYESELVRMTCTLLSGDPSQSCGALTSGGTESILMAIKAYRDSKPDILEPELVVPETAHPAFDKGCHYFRVKLVHVPVNEVTFVVDPDKMEKAITKNTIAIVGSAPNYPHGLIDPIQDLAKIALKHKVGLHVDCCLGGYFLPFLRKSVHNKDRYKIAPFDFSVPGVTTISADLHKYGMAPKGVSAVLFSNHTLRKNMYFVCTDWPGGQYASPTMAGSRPGALIAGAWAMVNYIGENNYVRIAEQIRDLAIEISDGIRSIKELELIGDPSAMIVAWKATKASGLDVFKLVDAMKGWSLGTQQRPNTLHICLTYRHVVEGIGERFVRELREAVKKVKERPQDFMEHAPMYGMAASMPDRSMIKGFVSGVLDAILETS